MFESKELRQTPEGHYTVSRAPVGYVVCRAATGECIAWCERIDTARAVADSREWCDARDAEEEGRCRR